MSPAASSSAVSRPPATTPAPSVVIEPAGGFFDFDLRALWEHRELIYFMVWREVKSKYKQTVLGFGWTVVQPLLTTAIFWVIFSQFARVQSDGIPYPLFAFSGLLPWNYFSQAVSRSSSGLVGNANLVGKVYFPRLILPLSAVLVPIIDFLISLVVFIVLMLWYGMMPTAAMLALPLFMFVAFLTALGMGLWLSALHVKYRDIAVLVPFVVQVWMYASPVIYPLTMIPERWELLRRWYGLNPMVGVVSGVRWALTGGALPDARVAAISLIVVVAIFLSGLVYFRRAERQFADLI
jgi:lipopolysaccharide transport system permease protein